MKTKKQKIRNKNYMKEYRQRPKFKEYHKNYMKEYNSRLEVKEYHKEYYKEYYQKNKKIIKKLNEKEKEQ